jgi:dihydrofolate synthase/folylpolyglutamate synthase
LLETGLGGRLDATNVVARPALTVLTPIALDHQAFLGETLEAIATEKAGILKAGTLCVSAEQAAEAASVIRRRAEALHVPIEWEGEHWRVRDDQAEGSGTAGRMVYEAPGATWRLPAPGLTGHFQINNAGLAIAGARTVLGASLNWEAVARGIRAARWPGRLQRLDDGPLRALLPATWELWLDGAHNPAAAAALADEARQNWSDRPNAFIVGMLRTKDAAGFLAALAATTTDIVAVTIPEATAGLTAEELSDLGRSAGLGIKPATSVENGLRLLAASMSNPARVIICGSLYLAGWVLMRNAARADSPL